MFPLYPQYFFDVNDGGELPYQLEYAQVLQGRDPFITSENKQFGIYIQDDWQVTDKLLLNLGIRWDYEENPSYEDYVRSEEHTSELQSLMRISYAVFRLKK